MMGGRKMDDGNEETKRTKEIVYIVDSLLLNNNQIREINGLYGILNFVIPNPQNLLWLNLAYNYLVKIDEELL